MAWCIWCGTVPHVRHGNLDSTIEVCAKNNWLLYCGTTQILCVSQHVIWVYKMPVVQSALLLCSGKPGFLLAGSLCLHSTAWVQLERKNPSRKCILIILQMGRPELQDSFPPSFLPLKIIQSSSFSAYFDSLSAFSSSVSLLLLRISWGSDTTCRFPGYSSSNLIE